MRQRHGAKWRVNNVLNEHDRPLVHAHKSKNAMRIAYLSEAACKLGLRVGQGLADAKAVHPALDVIPSDADADACLLSAIADWCDRYTPLVSLNEPDGLFLDVTGCVHLFGSEQALLSDILSRLFDQGFAAQAAIASTPGVAWAASHYGSRAMTLIEAGAEASFLRTFQLSALRLDREILVQLNKVGLKTVGDIMDMPRAPLTRRFGRQPLLRLDQALGDLQEALSPRLPAPDFSAERRFAEPIGLVDDIERTLYSLAMSLKPQLEARCAGARALDFSLFRVDGAVMRLAVGASRPVRDAETIVKLFQERIKSVGEDFDAGYGFDLLRLNVGSWDHFETPQNNLTTDDQAHDPRDVEILMDRITARLGRNNVSGSPVRRPLANESHLPERAEMLVSHDLVSANQGDVDDGYKPQTIRPMRLLVPPEPVEVVAQVPEGPPMRLRWRRALYKIEKSEGPERFAGEWWREDVSDGAHEPPPRDYYRVEDADGRRFWIYREGLYGSRGTASPRWFMHGLFA
ncbi:MAG: DNA polymerase Y family protein [Pseudomonadota bacterium]